MKRFLFLLFIIFLTLRVNAQIGDTARRNTDSILLNQPRLRYTTKQLYIPGTLITLGVSTFFTKPNEGLKNELAEARNNHFSSFHTSVDNYAQFFPLAVTYGLDALGIPAKTDICNRTAIMLKGEGLMFATITLLKHSVNEKRPDGSRYSFPSGHTAQAFMAATFLSEEYGYRYKWMPYAAYTLAAGVGTLRMANNKHYICDVLVGAGIGILSMKVAYWTHQYKWGRKKRPVFEP